MAILPWWLVVALFVVIGLVATVILVRKDAADRTRGHRPALLFVGRFLAFLYAGVGLIGTVVNAIAMLARGRELAVVAAWPTIRRPQLQGRGEQR